MPKEKIGDSITVFTDSHPPRTDSPEYVKSRKWLMGVAQGGCYICGGPVDLSHPQAPANATGMQDHHGGGLYVKDILVGFNLFPLEWSMGFGADPVRVQDFVNQLKEAGLSDYALPINTTDDVMAWVDSVSNANVKLCAPHHIGHQSSHTPDVNGHEAVGIHFAPWPILAAQATCNWAIFDMWAGTTGTIAVAPSQTTPGGVTVMHVDQNHSVKNADGSQLQIGQELPASHPHSRAAHAGYTT